jgi:hypothetical protein
MDDRPNRAIHGGAVEQRAIQSADGHDQASPRFSRKPQNFGILKHLVQLP